MSSYNKVTEQKAKLEAKKNKLVLEENRLKQKEQKMRTRHLIEVGGLVVKAGLDLLPSNTLYGALLSLSKSLDKDNSIKDTWKKLGGSQFDIEQKMTTPVILKFETAPDKEMRDLIRKHKLSWNKFRNEWYGNVENLDALKKSLENIVHQIEIIPN